MSPRRWLSHAMLFLLVVLTGSRARADFDELLAHAPPQSNSLVMIDAGRLYESVLAKSEDWQGKHAARMSAGGILLPAGSTQLLVASHQDWQYLHPLWEAAVVQMADPPSPSVVATRDGGKVDVIGSRPTVILPDNAYLIDFDKNIVGIMAPANRQRIAEWLGYRGGGLGTSLTPYLQQAAEQAKTSRDQIVLAFDLEHLFSPEFINERLKTANSVRGAGSDLDQLSTLLAGVRGVTLGVFVDDSRHGNLRIDFSDDAAPLGTLAKPLVLETLAGAGAALEDLDSWTPSVDGRAVYLQGALSESGMRRLISLVELPTHWLVDAQSRQPADTFERNEVTPFASMAYFQSVTKLLDDINARKRTAHTLGQTALWYDMYARHIDRLPITNVDPQMLEYGAGTAEMLRQAGAALRGIGIEAAERKYAIYPELSGVYQYQHVPRYYTPYSPYGYGRPYGRLGYNQGALYFNYRNIAGERRKVEAEAQAKGATAAAEYLDEIANATVKIRNEMSAKYQLEF